MATVIPPLPQIIPLALIILITSIHVIHAVTLLPPKVRPNGLITLSVRVFQGCVNGSLATTEVTLGIPQEIPLVRIIENEQDTQKGWSTRFVQDADGKIRSITWSGGTVQPQFIQDFQVFAQIPNSVIGTRIYFPVFQSCTSNVQVQWIDRITTNIPPISPTFPQASATRPVDTSPPAATTTNMDLPPNIIREPAPFLEVVEEERFGGGILTSDDGDRVVTTTDGVGEVGTGIGVSGSTVMRTIAVTTRTRGGIERTGSLPADGVTATTTTTGTVGGGRRVKEWGFGLLVVLFVGLVGLVVV